MRPLRIATSATAIATAIVALTVSAEPASSSSKGRTPITTSAPTVATTATASSELRPSSLQ